MLKKLLVRNFPSTVDASAIENMFEEVADVENVTMGTVLINERQHRVAYVVMRTEQGAVNSMERFNGYATDGTTLIVTEDCPHQPDPNWAQRRKQAKNKIEKSKTAKKATL